MASSSSSSSSSLMASSAIPSTSATNEITPVEEQIQNPKVNGLDDKVNPVSNSLSHDQNKKKKSFFTYPFGFKLKKEKPIKENTLSPEEEAKMKKQETEKEINAITKSIKADFHYIQNASTRISNHEGPFNEAKEKFGELKHANVKDLRDFKKVVKTIKQQISTQDKKDDDGKEKEALFKQIRAIVTANKEVVTKAQLKLMPNLFVDPDFERTLQFQDFKARYNELPFELKLCLLCFAVFPENVEIKRRVLVYWWIGEGFVPPRKDRPEEKPENKPHWEKFDLKKNKPNDEDFTPEHWANHYFKTLLNMGFIESAQKKPNPKVDICKMHPFVRSMLNRIAKKVDFFEFDGDGTVNDKFSKSLRACLLYGNTSTENVKEDDKGDNKEDDKGNVKEDDKGNVKEDDKGNVKEDDKPLKNLHAMINVDKAILDIKQDTLSKMRNVNILYLGRWQSLGTHHIEVDDTKILDANKGNTLDGLQNIKNLKFLSLQGISRINELPKSILKLQNLTILDIRACHNLETIPDDIGCLVNLTHLDMSECYLLDEMPKGISKLTKLQVLSGFVVLESENKKSCTLDDLKGFTHLRKLSIHSGSNKFPEEKDLKALNQFKKLSKLTIAWGRGSVNTQRATLERSTTIAKGNEEEGNKGGINIGEQGNNKVNLSKKQTLKKGSSDQDSDQNPEKDNLEGRKKYGLQNQERTENSGEINGKGTHKVATGEIVEDPNPSTDLPCTSPSKKVAYSLDTVKKGLEKNRESTKSREAKSPEKKLLTGRLKGLLGCGLEGKLVKRLTTKKIDHAFAELPSLLTKLDLQCLPGLPHEWLRPEKLLRLEKLYIRGGKLSDLGQFHDLDDSSEKRKWDKVTELRLKYLDEVEMEWRELLELFPKLDYLEKVDCPKLSFFPCDEMGVWTKKKTVS